MEVERLEKRFEFLEHTADAYIAAYGESLEQAFENAAYATFEVMTRVETVQPLIKDLVEVEASDEYALLYNWVEELLIRFEMTGNLFSRFEILKIEETTDGLKLHAKIWGEPFNPEKHPQRVGVKAITYHQMEIVKKAKEVIVRFILDI